jgi:hypothetical protein
MHIIDRLNDYLRNWRQEVIVSDGPIKDAIKVIESQLPTDEEDQIMKNLVVIWNDFVDLGEHHPDDLNEFRISLHRLQHIVMSRRIKRIDDTSVM